MDNKIEMIRTLTRAMAFLIPLSAVCIGMFTLPEVQDTLIGAVMGSASTAGIFYFKKEEN